MIILKTMEQNFKNYIRVKTIDDYYREHIDDYEIKFDRYNRINVSIWGDHCYAHRRFEYQGRSIKKLLENIKKHIIVPKEDHWVISDLGYEQFILEVIDIQIPDNPEENKIFDNYPDLYLGMTEEQITFILPQIKEYIKSNIKNEPGFELEIYDKFYGGGDNMRPYCIVNMIYGYTKRSKLKCKIKRFGVNPGGRFYFPVYNSQFTQLQNLIKEYVES